MKSVRSASAALATFNRGKTHRLYLSSSTTQTIGFPLSGWESALGKVGWKVKDLTLSMELDSNEGLLNAVSLRWRSSHSDGPETLTSISPCPRSHDILSCKPCRTGKGRGLRELLRSANLLQQASLHQLPQQVGAAACGMLFLARGHIAWAHHTAILFTARTHTNAPQESGRRVP